jgi:hypothetical protein
MKGIVGIEIDASEIFGCIESVKDVDCVCPYCQVQKRFDDVDVCRLQGIRCSMNICPVYSTFDEWKFGRKVI